MAVQNPSVGIPNILLLKIDKQATSSRSKRQTSNFTTKMNKQTTSSQSKGQTSDDAVNIDGRDTPSQIYGTSDRCYNEEQ